MIDFSLDDNIGQLREMAHWLAENEFRPLSLEADRTGEVPIEFHRKMKAMGVSLTTNPESSRIAARPDGKKGPKVSSRLSVVGAEEIAWGDAGLALGLPGPGLGGPPVRFMGTPAQQEKFLGMLSRDDEPRWGAYALTEPGAGSDVSGIRTTCRRDGDDWIVNGAKVFITNGARADWVVVFATMDAALGRAGHRAFVVEKGTPGFRVGKIEKKMGLRASETAELVFEECRVPGENLLGGEEHYASKEGFLGAMKTFDSTRPVVGAMAVGIARAAYERAKAFAGEAFAGSTSTRAREAQATLEKDARKLEAARLLCWRAAWMADESIPNSKEASMAKAYGAQIALEVCADAVRVMGASGVRHDAFVEKWFRDIKVFDIFEGTGQIQRVVIAKRLIDGLKSF